MFRSIHNGSGTYFPRANRFLLFAATACAGLLFVGARNTQAAFSVAKNGDTLTIKGPIVNYGDTVLILGTGPAQVEVWDCGAFAGAFSQVAHISVAVSGGNKVTVRVLGVDVSGGLAIKTGQGPDGVLLVSNQIGGKVQVWSGAGDDTIGVHHNLCDGLLSVVSAGGSDSVGLRDNEVLGDVTLETGAEDDAVEVRDNRFAGSANIASGTGNDEVNVGYTVNGTPYSANTIRGDLTVASSGGNEHFDVDSNRIGGNVVLAVATGDGFVYVRQNRIEGSVCVTTADGMDSIDVRTNEIGADLSISTGASNWQKYVVVEEENLVRGDLSINVAPCAWALVWVRTNDLRRDTAVAVVASSFISSEIDVAWNMLHGNATVDTTSSAIIDLDGNTVLGTLSVNTGNESDSVELGSNVCDSDVTIELGDGDDDLTLGQQPTGPDPNQFAAQLTVDGGAGFDQLSHNLLNSYGVPPSSQGFESIVP